MHDRKEVVCRAELESKDDGVYLKGKLLDTARSRDLATEIRAGLHRGLSVEFKSIKEKSVQGVRVILDAVIGGAGVVTDGAYATTVEARDKDKGQERPASGLHRRWCLLTMRTLLNRMRSKAGVEHRAVSFIQDALNGLPKCVPAWRRPAYRIARRVVSGKVPVRSIRAIRIHTEPVT